MIKIMSNGIKQSFIQKDRSPISEKINKQYDIVAYVPLYESKERERGFNQSKIIAQRKMGKKKGERKKTLMISPPW